MSKSHEIDCWKCGEQSTLKTRSEFDGCCWACGAEIDLEDYLARATDERDQLRAEVEALRKDAERYRWLRTYAYGHFHGEELEDLFSRNDSLVDEKVDEAIDAAMAAKDGQP